MTSSLRVRLLWWMLVPLALYVIFTATSEFRDTCPVSATCMSIRLPPP